MSFTKRYIEWDIPASEVQYGVPVGFEVELSQNSSFNPKTYRLSTYEENHEALNARFSYSLDNGGTWVPYTFGETGLVFNQTFRMRLEVAAAHAGSIIVLNANQVYKASGDLETIEETLVVDLLPIQDTSYGTKTDTLFAVSQNTLYRIQTRPALQPYNFSFNVAHDNILGIVVDESRESFWQINRDSVCLKNLYGEEYYRLSLPEQVDIDYSSSSSSSLSSSSSSSQSSSSSLGYSSSSSSFGFSSSSS